MLVEEGAPQKQEQGVLVFFSYSHRDKVLRDKLEEHLSILKYRGLISMWHDREIQAGQEWSQQIDIHLNNAHIILLLISSSFMASGYCYSIEMKRALERHEQKDAEVVPILLRPVLYTGAPFEKLQMLPSNGRPVVKWRPTDDAFCDIARNVEKIVRKYVLPPPRDQAKSAAPQQNVWSQAHPQQQSAWDQPESEELWAAPSAPTAWPQQGGFGNMSGAQPDPAASPFGSGDIDSERTVLRSPGQQQGTLGIVRVEEGKEPGRIYEVRMGTLSIGRSRDSDIFLEDLAVSRLHASIVNMGNGNHALKDEGSANGTKVNGTLLNKYQTYPLQEGDRVQLGQTVLVFGRQQQQTPAAQQPQAARQADWEQQAPAQQQISPPSSPSSTGSLDPAPSGSLPPLSPPSPIPPFSIQDQSITSPVPQPSVPSIPPRVRHRLSRRAAALILGLVATLAILSGTIYLLSSIFSSSYTPPPTPFPTPIPTPIPTSPTLSPLIFSGILILLLLVISFAAVLIAMRFIRAKTRRRHKYYEEAVEVYQRALRRHPRDGYAFQGMGKALSALGRYDRALDAFRQAIEHLPASDKTAVSAAYAGVGGALARLKRNDEAVAAYEQAMALDSTVTFNHNDLIRALLALGRKEEAARIRERAKQPDRADI